MFFNKVTHKINAIRNVLENKIVNLFMPLYRKILPAKWGVNTVIQRSPMIIVSLTTFPARLDIVHLCIETLLNQTLRPDKIILYLYDGECRKENLPTSLKILQKYGLEIKYVHENLMPHKKYYYAMQEYKDALIITVDDDCYYSRHLVEDLVKSHKTHAKDVICTRAHKMIVDNGKILPYKSWIYQIENEKESSHYLFATGIGGVLYPPHCLKEIAFNKNLIISECLKADDIWLKTMEIISNTKVYNLPQRFFPYYYDIHNSQKCALVSENVGSGGNDIYISALFDKFDIYNRLEHHSTYLHPV